MFYRRHRRVSLQTPHACVRVTSIPVAPPRAASIEPPELRRARRSRPLAIRVGGIRAHSRPRIGAPNASAAHAVSSRRARRSIARGRSRGNPRSAARSASPRQGGRSRVARETRGIRRGIGRRWFGRLSWYRLVRHGLGTNTDRSFVERASRKSMTHSFFSRRVPDQKEKLKGDERRFTSEHLVFDILKLQVDVLPDFFVAPTRETRPPDPRARRRCLLLRSRSALVYLTGLARRCVAIP